MGKIIDNDDNDTGEMMSKFENKNHECVRNE